MRYALARIPNKLALLTGRILPVLFGLISCNSAWAGCNWIGRAVSVPFAASYVAHTNETTGTVIGQATARFTIDCSVDTSVQYGTPNQLLSWPGSYYPQYFEYHGQYLLPSGLDGIGIRVIGGENTGGPSVIYGGGFAMSYALDFPMGSRSYSLTYQVVVTSRMTKGGFTQSRAFYNAYRLGGSSGDAVRFGPNIVVSSFRVDVMPPTCMVDPSSVAQTVNLPDISAKAAAGSVGTGTGFNIGLTCDGLEQKNIYVTFSDVNKPANTSKILSLSPDSTAKGVGVQISNGAGPIGYGADTTADDTVNTWYVQPTVAGKITIPLSAALIRTADAADPGTANAQATFTMSYR